ncbi:FISUMP domain-containing protein [Riemerella anatipestifer]|uniref:FISUMP domain-containing protein n=1 Tax=Riemerella anatipestifer TaxID=34085 RepID=A0AAP6LKM8_RIEAN|nr:FISUMP domain-containing protein [Riemerella anatipestifer]MBT0549562.1 hypothetical protein [Riemerella anatipestifer]MBT0556296.1 hypothetical protein [Riemerella anatipestifer]MBT0560285.1 hypothetical protein [Riemerella anatipestifer]MCD5969469.1 hypothetical protein [Riemerella anatipestifer]MCO7354206.1 hypothetical protein [Riemerella anatipestifer]
MKKILLCAVFLPLVLNAQDYNGRVGINTDKPKATLEISKVAVSPTMPATKAQGVLFPKFSTIERNKFSSTTEIGTMIYNTDKSCIEIYQGVISGVHQWQCMPGSNQTQSLAVTAAGFEGSYIGAVPFNSNNRVKFRLENNSFSSVSSAFHDAVTVHNGSANISAGNCQWQKLPTGSVAPCTSGNLISLNSGESAMLWYTLSGTPETGTLQAKFSKLQIQIEQSTTVDLGSATITSPKTEYVVSLTYAGTTLPGIMDNGTNKFTFKIPYTNGSGSYTTVDTAPITTATGEGGDINTVKLTIPSGNFAVNGSLEATIVVGGTDTQYNARLLSPGQEYEIATIPYTLNGNSYQVVLKGIGGIPDRCFGKTTFDCVGYGANEKEHQFLYIPITGPDGRTWLNNNLGAEYAKVGSPWFKPTRQAGALDPVTGQEVSNPTTDQIKKDWRAYGSLFQWQRNPDGHELMNWTSTSTGTTKYGTTNTASTSWTNPNNNLFIAAPYDIYYPSWVTNTLHNSINNKNLWQVGGSTNPCPTGYHVPTYEEMATLYTSITGITSVGTIIYDAGAISLVEQEPTMKFSSAGLRHYSSNLLERGNGMNLWTSSDDRYNNYRVNALSIHSAREMRVASGHPGVWGYSVRCIKD